MEILKEEGNTNFLNNDLNEKKRIEVLDFKISNIGVPGSLSW